MSLRLCEKYRIRIMQAKIGNKVKFINDDATGIIIKVISEKELEIEDNHGFTLRVSINEVIVIDDNEDIVYTVDNTEYINQIDLRKEKFKSNSKLLDKYKKLNKYKYENTLEIDLHLEELVEFPTRLEDWQKLYTQINHAKKCIEAAQSENIPRIIFIHGKGTGVLKTELRNMLSNTYELQFSDADYREYSTGATEVYLR